MLAFIGLLLLNLCSVASANLEPCDVSLFARSYIAVMQYNTIAMVDGNHSSMAALNAELDALFAEKFDNKANQGRMFYTMNFEHLLVTIVYGGSGLDVGLISVKEMAERKSVQIEEIAFGKPENRVIAAKNGAFRPSDNSIHFNDGTNVTINIESRTIEKFNSKDKTDIFNMKERIYSRMGERMYSRDGATQLHQMEAGKFYIRTSLRNRTLYSTVLVFEDSSKLVTSSCELRRYPQSRNSPQLISIGRILIIPKNGDSKGVDFVFEKPITSRVFQTTTTEASLNSTSIPDSELDSNSTRISRREERVDSTTMSILSSRERVEIQGEKVKIVIEGKRVKSKLEEPKRNFGVYMTIAVFTVILVCTVASISIVMNFL